MIDFDNNEPFFLTIKQNNRVITQKVRPEAADMEMHTDTMYAYNTKGQRLVAFDVGHRLETNIQFIALPWDNDKKLCEVKEI